MGRKAKKAEFPTELFVQISRDKDGGTDFVSNETANDTLGCHLLDYSPYLPGERVAVYKFVKKIEVLQGDPIVRDLAK